MNTPEIESSQPYNILVVDDEPDIFEITKLTLKNFKHKGREVKLHFASSGEKCIEIMRSKLNIAVILLDVIMEIPTAGLGACQTVRKELNNHLVRILLRTGQPNIIPERSTIDDYDIDGYLAKAEITSNRLYSTIRAALRAWDQLVQIDRQQRYLQEINNYAIDSRTFEPIEKTLSRTLKAIMAICPTQIGVLKLETFREKGNPAVFQLYHSTFTNEQQASSAFADIISRISQHKDAEKMRFPLRIENGYYIPLSLHGELGSGWIFLDQVNPDDLVINGIAIITAHAENALYALIARELLQKQHQEPFFNTIDI